MKMVEKTSKKEMLKVIIISALIVSIVVLVRIAFARYITRLNGSTQVPIAQWNFKVTAGSSQSLDIDLANTRFLDDTQEVDRTKVAPGTAGALQLNINATGSQVSLEYTIDLTLTQIPENLIFYSDAEMTKALYKDNGVIHLDGYFGASDTNKTATKNLYWQWKLETGSTQAEINANDLLDSEWIGDRIVLGVEAKGRQVMDSPTTQYAVTFDLNGGTLTNHGDSTQITKNVNYGETYGALPTPTREGYTFMGWNGKNMFTGLVKGVRLDDNIGIQINGNAYATSNYIEVNFTNNTYYLSGLSNNLYSYVSVYDENKEFLGRTAGTSRTKILLNSAQIQAYRSFDTSEAKYIRIMQYEHSNTTGIIDDIDNLEIMLEEGSTATAYEPYYITSSTEIVQNYNHTLTAIWEKE